ncbi:MAG: hypothetical protein ACOC4C_00835 [Fibrobacterota bacterium]
MDNMWEKVKKSLKEGASMSVEKIEEYSKIGKLKIEEIAAKRKIERNFMDIGERMFDLMNQGKSGSDIEEDITIKKAIENVKGLKEELSVTSEKIKAASEDGKNKEETVTSEQ